MMTRKRPRSRAGQEDEKYWKDELMKEGIEARTMTTATASTIAEALQEGSHEKMQLNKVLPRWLREPRKLQKGGKNEGGKNDNEPKTAEAAKNRPASRLSCY